MVQHMLVLQLVDRPTCSQIHSFGGALDTALGWKPKMSQNWLLFIVVVVVVVVVVVEVVDLQTQLCYHRQEQTDL